MWLGVCWGMGGGRALELPPLTFFRHRQMTPTWLCLFRPMVIVVINMVIDGHGIQVSPMRLIPWPVLMGSTAKEAGGGGKPGPVGLGPD